CLPPYMWDRRLEPRTPMPGVFLCGACTHPGGSVIAINGRNAAWRSRRRWERGFRSGSIRTIREGARVSSWVPPRREALGDPTIMVRYDPGKEETPVGPASFRA